MGRLSILFSTASLAALVSGTAALAQSAGAPQAVQEIVVTGTLVRGVAATGANVRTLGQELIQQSGAQDIPQLLANLPQLDQFGQIGQSPVQNAVLSSGRSSYRPELRGLPSGTVSPVLVMVDGHPLVGAGIQQTDADPGMLPPGALERVEVVLDGGSSLYGANAIGGVLNFITRTHFKGIEISGNAGTAVGGYHSSEVDLTAGKDWNGGGAVLALYDHQNNGMQATALEFPRQDLRQYGLPDYRVQTCGPGNVIVGANTYGIQSNGTIGPAGSTNKCDILQQQDIASAQHQSGGYLSLSQSLAPTLDFNVKIFGSTRITTPQYQAPTEASAVIDTKNPFFQSVAGATKENLQYSYSPIYGPRESAKLQLDEYDIAPTLTWHLPGGWRGVGTVDYGWSKTFQSTPGLNNGAEATALSSAGLTTATALNPYNLAATNSAVIANILNWRTQAQNVQTQLAARAVFDGAIWTLPAGQVKAAVGVQFQRQGTDGYLSNGPNGTLAGARTEEWYRNVYSAFGELNIPVIGTSNSMPLIRSFDIDVSARFDNYDQVGSTVNPRVGVTWVVADGYKIRGDYATAFTAPTVVDEGPTGSLDANISVVQTGQQGTQLLPEDPQSLANLPSLNVGGAFPGVEKPQTATTFSIGMDINPPQLSGLQISGTFWRVDMKDTLINGCPGTLVDQLRANVEGCDLYRPTLAQLNRVLPPGLPVLGASSVAALYDAGTPPYLLRVFNRDNGGGFQTWGVDYSGAYRHTTSWGALYGSLNGTLYIRRANQASPGAPFISSLINVRTYRFLATLGVDLGEKLTASAQFLYNPSYKVNNLVNQTQVGSFMPINVFVKYNIDPSLSVSLNVNNLLATLPPRANISGGIYTAGAIFTDQTLGRYISVGLRKRF
jgi:iron complex outermembrane receptor protein